MTQTSNRLFDEMARLMNDAAGAAQGVKREVETVMRGQAERILRDLDLVKREEFEAEEPGTAASQEEFGDLLFALVNVARWSGVDAEEALAASNRKFRRRWARMEELARAQGRAVEDLSTVEQNELWDRAKGEEKPAE